MSGSPAREPRSAVMILVDASWQDPTGALQNAPARIENRSESGACIRCKAPPGVGVRLQIRGRWESFAGISKYCRNVGGEFLVGLEREKGEHPPLDVVAVTVPANAAAREVEAVARTESAGHANSLSPAQALVSADLAKPANTLESARIAAVMELLRIHPPVRIREEPVSETQIARPAVTETAAINEIPPKPARTAEATHSRKQGARMTRKWLEVGQWGKKEGETEGEHADHDAPKGANGVGPNGASHALQGKVAAHTADAHSPAPKSADGSSFPVELASMDDIYRAAGIMNPRRGYSITKVVEMLHSEHIRGLPKEMRRAAVLMALDAAEIPLDEVLRDAKIRQEAIDKYESEQRRQIEAEWARKTEENTQIQAELERVKAHYMERIRRNVEGMAREKATFGNWLTLKQQESQSMAEAVELCLKPPVPENANNSLAGMTLPDASAKPV